MMASHPTYPHTPQLPRYRGRDFDGRFTPKGSGFNAFGHPVSEWRRNAAKSIAVEQMGVSVVMAEAAVNECADYIADDDPERAMLVLRAAVDLTGAYRLLATLCTA